MTIAKMLNLGSGRTKFPGPRPDHHALVPESIYAYPAWLNISRNASEEPDCVMDLFAYPWDLPSDTFEGALLAHLCEHIPHEITLAIQDADGDLFDDNDTLDLDIFKARVKSNMLKTGLKDFQDGWYAFFSELYRVLKPGAMVHILSPHAFSTGAMHDPTHTRYLLPETFTHSMQPNPDAPFEYAASLHFEIRDYRPGLSQYFAHMAPLPTDSPDVQQHKNALLMEAAATRVNVISEFYVKLEAIK